MSLAHTKHAGSAPAPSPCLACRWTGHVAPGTWGCLHSHCEYKTSYLIQTLCIKRVPRHSRGPHPLSHHPEVMPSVAQTYDSPGVTQRWGDPGWKCRSPSRLWDYPCFLSSQALEWGWAGAGQWEEVCLGTALLLLLQPCPRGVQSVLCFPWPTGLVACGCEPPGTPGIFSHKGFWNHRGGHCPPSASPAVFSAREGKDGMKGREPQTRPGHLKPTLFSGPVSDFGQGQASWTNGSFVSPPEAWTPNCFVLFSLSTEHPTPWQAPR